MTSQKVVCYQMATSRVKTNLFLTFKLAAKWQYVCYTQRYYRLISKNQVGWNFPDHDSKTPKISNHAQKHKKKCSRIYCFLDHFFQFHLNYILGI